MMPGGRMGRVREGQIGKRIERVMRECGGDIKQKRGPLSQRSSLR